MKELPISALSAILTEHQSQTLLVSSPNYEPRSTSSITVPIQTLATDAWEGHLLVIQIASTERRVEPLEWLNRLNAASFGRISEKRNFTIQRISYPYTGDRIHHELEHGLRHLNRPYRIVMDITSLPRSIIAEFMGFVSTHAHNIERVFFMYTWAGGYPHLTHPAATGDLIGIRKKINMHRLIARARRPAALVFPGRQGFDAQQVADAFHECGERITVAALFDGDDPLLSLSVQRANADLLGDRKVDVHYYFDLKEAYKLVETWARDCLAEGHDALFVAPFGPKPLVVWSWLQLSKSLAEWDILLSNQNTLLTTYSLGRGRTSLFELSKDDLIVPKTPAK